jgi:cytochrome c oxidase subunit 2
VPADDAYLRESILYPAAKVTFGYQPVMPTFRGLVNEEGILELIEFLKSRSAGGEGVEAPVAVPPPAAPHEKRPTP